MKTLTEVMKVSKDDLPTIYCDLDQVLVAFLKGAEKVIGGDFASMDKEKRWVKNTLIQKKVVLSNPF